MIRLGVFERVASRTFPDLVFTPFSTILNLGKLGNWGSFHGKLQIILVCEITLLIFALLLIGYLIVGGLAVEQLNYIC